LLESFCDTELVGAHAVSVVVVSLPVVVVVSVPVVVSASVVVPVVLVVVVVLVVSVDAAFEPFVFVALAVAFASCLGDVVFAFLGDVLFAALAPPFGDVAFVVFFGAVAFAVFFGAVAFVSLGDVALAGAVAFGGFGALGLACENAGGDTSITMAAVARDKRLIVRIWTLLGITFRAGQRTGLCTAEQPRCPEARLYHFFLLEPGE
jgi:hypothetical protein